MDIWGGICNLYGFLGGGGLALGGLGEDRLG